MTRDRWYAFAALIICVAGFLATLVSWGEQPHLGEHVGEYYALLATAAAGMIFLTGASNLMTIFLGLEWFSIALYIMCAVSVAWPSSLEAGLKYLVVGSFGSAVLLFGSALVYGGTGELSCRGSRTPRSRATGSRRGAGDDPRRAGLQGVRGALPHVDARRLPGLADRGDGVHVGGDEDGRARVLYRVLVTAFPQEAGFWTATIAAIAVASLAVGNLAALVQRDLKRMLAYSSISHAGFMLIPIAANSELGGRALLFYLVPYSAMSIGAFAVVAARERELGRPVDLDNLSGLGWERPFLGISMWVFMLGFAGLPLTGGFVGKFYAFSAAYDSGMIWLIIVGVVATAVSLYYYLGVDPRPLHARRAGAAAGRRGRRSAARLAAARRRRRGARRDGGLVLRSRADHRACARRSSGAPVLSAATTSAGPSSRSAPTALETPSAGTPAAECARAAAATSTSTAPRPRQSVSRRSAATPGARPGSSTSSPNADSAPAAAAASARQGRRARFGAGPDRPSRA